MLVGLLVFLWENLCCFYGLAFMAWLRHRVCARVRRGRDRCRTHLLQLENWDFSIWVKYLEITNALKGVCFTMRASARWGMMSSVTPFIPDLNLSIMLIWSFQFGHLFPTFRHVELQCLCCGKSVLRGPGRTDLALVWQTDTVLSKYVPERKRFSWCSCEWFVVYASLESESDSSLWKMEFFRCR